MPKQFPADLHRRTCERMLADEAVKDRVVELGNRRVHPLQMAAPGADRRRAENRDSKSYEADPLAAPRRFSDFRAH
jgi:hypothetical protein